MSGAVATQPPDARPTGEKRERGAYYTPDALALAICCGLQRCIDRPWTIFEPGCGGGAFLRAAAVTWPKAELTGVDLVPACDGPGKVEKRDLFEVKDRFDLIVGNQDFTVAELVVRHCMLMLRPGGSLALLLRLSFLAGQKRAQLYRDHPLRFLQPIAGRPSFTGDGRTDPIEYGLFVWRSNGRGHGELLPPLEWKP